MELEVTCLNCHGAIACNETDLGEIVWCPHCGEQTSLIITESDTDSEPAEQALFSRQRLKMAAAALAVTLLLTGLFSLRSPKQLTTEEQHAELLDRLFHDDRPWPPKELVNSTYGFRDTNGLQQDCVTVRLKILKAFEQSVSLTSENADAITITPEILSEQMLVDVFRQTNYPSCPLDLKAHKDRPDCVCRASFRRAYYPRCTEGGTFRICEYQGIHCSKHSLPDSKKRLGLGKAFPLTPPIPPFRQPDFEPSDNPPKIEYDETIEFWGTNQVVDSIDHWGLKFKVGKFQLANMPVKELKPAELLALEQNGYLWESMQVFESRSESPPLANHLSNVLSQIWREEPSLMQRLRRRLQIFAIMEEVNQLHEDIARYTRMEKSFNRLSAYQPPPFNRYAHLEAMYRVSPKGPPGRSGFATFVAPSAKQRRGIFSGVDMSGFNSRRSRVEWREYQREKQREEKQIRSNPEGFVNSFQNPVDRILAMRYVSGVTGSRNPFGANSAGETIINVRDVDVDTKQFIMDAFDGEVAGGDSLRVPIKPAPGEEVLRPAGGSGVFSVRAPASSASSTQALDAHINLNNQLMAAAMRQRSQNGIQKMGQLKALARERLLVYDKLLIQAGVLLPRYQGLPGYVPNFRMHNWLAERRVFDPDKALDSRRRTFESKMSELRDQLKRSIYATYFGYAY